MSSFFGINKNINITRINFNDDDNKINEDDSEKEEEFGDIFSKLPPIHSPIRNITNLNNNEIPKKRKFDNEVNNILQEKNIFFKKIKKIDFDSLEKKEEIEKIDFALLPVDLFPLILKFLFNPNKEKQTLPNISFISKKFYLLSKESQYSFYNNLIQKNIQKLFADLKLFNKTDIFNQHEDFTFALSIEKGAKFIDENYLHPINDKNTYLDFDSNLKDIADILTNKKINDNKKCSEFLLIGTIIDKLCHTYIDSIISQKEKKILPNLDIMKEIQKFTLDYKKNDTLRILDKQKIVYEMVINLNNEYNNISIKKLWKSRYPYEQITEETIKDCESFIKEINKCLLNCLGDKSKCKSILNQELEKLRKHSKEDFFIEIKEFLRLFDSLNGIPRESPNDISDCCSPLDSLIGFFITKLKDLSPSEFQNLLNSMELSPETALACKQDYIISIIENSPSRLEGVLKSEDKAFVDALLKKFIKKIILSTLSEQDFDSKKLISCFNKGFNIITKICSAFELPKDEYSVVLLRSLMPRIQEHSDTCEELVSKNPPKICVTELCTLLIEKAISVNEEQYKIEMNSLVERAKTFHNGQAEKYNKHKMEKFHVKFL